MRDIPVRFFTLFTRLCVYFDIHSKYFEITKFIFLFIKRDLLISFIKRIDNPRLEFWANSNISAFNYMLLSYTGYTFFFFFTNCTLWFWYLSIKISTHLLYSFLKSSKSKFVHRTIIGKLVSENCKYLTMISVVFIYAHVHCIFYLFVSFISMKFRTFVVFFVYVYVTKDKSDAFRKPAGVNICVFGTCIFRSYFSLLLLKCNWLLWWDFD